jgi:hypothetical protein
MARNANQRKAPWRVVACFVFAAASFCYGIAKNDVRVKTLAVFGALSGGFAVVGLRRTMISTQIQTLGFKRSWRSQDY